jgi:putative sigma-54 modulation protein
LLFTISGKHVGVTEAVKKYAQKKTSKLPRYYSGINQIEVLIDGSKGGKTNVEIIARGEHSRVFVGTEGGENVYKCIDLAIRKLEKQLTKEKTRERDNKHIVTARKTKAAGGGGI